MRRHIQRWRRGGHGWGGRLLQSFEGEVGLDIAVLDTNHVFGDVDGDDLDGTVAFAFAQYWLFGGGLLARLGLGDLDQGARRAKNTENAGQHDLGRRWPGRRLRRRSFLRRWRRFDAKYVALDNGEERIAACLVLIFIRCDSGQRQSRQDSP
jgi:hypothetical protein